MMALRLLGLRKDSEKSMLLSRDMLSGMAFCRIVGRVSAGDGDMPSWLKLLRCDLLVSYFPRGSQRYSGQGRRRGRNSDDQRERRTFALTYGGNAWYVHHPPRQGI